MELVIVVAVIGILAAILAPVILGQVEKARVAAEKQSIAELGKAFARFAGHTGGWPYLNSVWDPSDPMSAASGGVDPTRFGPGDTALHQPPGGLPGCNTGNIGDRCWAGPYLGAGSSLGSPQMLDAWGRPRMFAIIPPVPLGGSVPQVPNGAVVIWSTGADGKDQTGCSDGGCTWNKAATALGEPSAGSGSDDIVVVAGGVL